VCYDLLSYQDFVELAEQVDIRTRDAVPDEEDLALDGVAVVGD